MKIPNLINCKKEYIDCFCAGWNNHRCGESLQKMKRMQTRNYRLLIELFNNPGNKLNAGLVVGLNAGLVDGWKARHDYK